MSDDLDLPGADERLAAWREQVQAERRPLPRAVRDSIQQRLAELGAADPILGAYLGAFRDSLGRHSDSVTLNLEDRTYTLRSQP